MLNGKTHTAVKITVLSGLILAIISGAFGAYVRSGRNEDRIEQNAADDQKTAKALRSSIAAEISFVRTSLDRELENIRTQMMLDRASTSAGFEEVKDLIREESNRRRAASSEQVALLLKLIANGEKKK